MNDEKIHINEINLKCRYSVIAGGLSANNQNRRYFYFSTPVNDADIQVWFDTNTGYVTGIYVSIYDHTFFEYDQYIWCADEVMTNGSVKIMICSQYEIYAIIRKLYTGEK